MKVFLHTRDSSLSFLSRCWTVINSDGLKEKRDESLIKCRRRNNNSVPDILIYTVWFIQQDLIKAIIAYTLKYPTVQLAIYPRRKPVATLSIKMMCFCVYIDVFAPCYM